MSDWETITPQRRATDGWETVSAPAAKPDSQLSRSEFAKKYYDPKRQWGMGVENAAYELGGKVTDVTGSPGAGYVTNVAAQAVPALFGGQVLKQAGAPLMRSGAESLMASALKPTLQQNKTGVAKSAVRTMLDEGLNATAGGVSKLKDRIGQLNQEISDAIANSVGSVDKNAVAKRLADVYAKFRNQVNPQTDTAAIDAAKDAFLTHPDLAGLQTIPVQLAQDMKVGTYRVLKGKYGQIGSAETEAQKALARGLKEEIATAVPQVAPLNARESRLLDALSVAERRTMVDANKNPLGLSLLADDPLRTAGFLADRSALVKSLVARAMNAGSEVLPATGGYGLGALIGAQSGMAPDYGLAQLMRRQ